MINTTRYRYQANHTCQSPFFLREHNTFAIAVKKSPEMNFISKIIRKPGDTEPQLKQAHTGEALAARYDENLKRWIFPGEVCSFPLK